jgi:hypothetical protein
MQRWWMTGIVTVALSAGAWSPGIAEEAKRIAPEAARIASTDEFWAKKDAPRGVPAYQPVGAKTPAAGENATTLQVLGIPLVPTSQFPHGARSAVFTMASLADSQLAIQLRRFLASGSRALITGRLADRLGRLPSQYADRVYVLRGSQREQALTALPQDTVDGARNFLLHPMGLRIQAPPKVIFRIVGSDAIVVENTNAWAAGVKITFRRDRWPRLAALQSDGGSVPLQMNLATFQVPPKSARMFRVARG